MSRFLKALALVVFVASCGGGNYTSPRNMDNACSIVNERPHYLQAMKRTQAKWRVPIAVQMAVIHQESKFIGNARPPGRASSALGYSQALDGTWREYRTAEGGFGADRTDIFDATDFMGWYFTETERRLGIPLYDTKRQYLAYHEGRTGFARGSYRRKGWLLDIANKVADRAIMYDIQLRSCGMV